MAVLPSRFLVLHAFTFVLCSGFEDLVVKTSQGPVRGFILNDMKVWRGIPFAEPPLHDLRLRPPQPPRVRNETLNATAFGPSCLQSGSRGYSKGGPGWNTLNLTKSSEDCLYLNVYTSTRAQKPLPVMVYINAGEFQFGTANDLESDFPHFAGDSVVVVTANTRLGFFGFAALDELRSRDPTGSTGNYGMQDQRAVLEWVKASITAFGGNASQITIFGESSGGSSVAFHMLSQRSKGLFSQAILESPGLTQSKPWSDAVENTKYAISALTSAATAGCQWPAAVDWIHLPGVVATLYGKHPLAFTTKGQALAECEKRTECFLVSVAPDSNVASLFAAGSAGSLGDTLPILYNISAHLGVETGAAAFVRMPTSEHAEKCLLGAASADLLALGTSTPHGDTFLTDSAAPTVDGVELSVPLSELASQNVPGDMPVMGGTNLDEGTEFMYLVPSLACNATEAEFTEWATKMFGPELGPKVPSLYRSIEQPAPLCGGGPFKVSKPSTSTSIFWQAAMRSAGDSAILCRTRALLRAASEKGNKAWWYYFTHTPKYSANMGDLRYYGAFHGSEVPFVWDDAFEVLGKKEHKLSRAMGCYWVNFAATGNPNEGPSNCISALSLPQWPAFGDGDALQLSAEHLQVRKALKKAQCEIFTEHNLRPMEDVFTLML